MRENIQVSRRVCAVLPSVDERGLVLLTGARQTGKTTAAQLVYKGVPYFNLDAVEFRHMKALAKALEGRWLGGMVLYRGAKIASLAPGFWAVPTWRLFGM